MKTPCTTPIRRVALSLLAELSPSALGAALGILAALMPGAAGAATLYGLVDTGELFASNDGGASWAIRATLPVRDAVSLAAGASDSELILATETGSLYRSVDGGSNWSAVGAVTASQVIALVPRPERLLLLTRSGSVLTSLDQGASFSATGAIPAPDVVSGARHGILTFVLTRSGTVYRSDDGGATWSATSTLPASDAVELVAFAGRLYALTASGDVARSDHPWTGWTFVGTLSQMGMTALLAAGGELLACTAAGEVAASSDGITWTWRGAINQITVRSLGSDVSATTDVGPRQTTGVRFASPWPNPARSRVQLAFELPEASRVTVEVFDALGRIVARPLARETLPAGHSRRAWEPGSLPDGAYCVRARGDHWSETRRLVLLPAR